MPTTDDDDDDFLTDMVTLGAAATEARDETLPQAVRDSSEWVVEQIADKYKK